MLKGLAAVRLERRCSPHHAAHQGDLHAVASSEIIPGVSDARVYFGRTAGDYARHRAGFPDELFDRLRSIGVGCPAERVLDRGTGTGTLARGFALRGCEVVAIDPGRRAARASPPSRRAVWGERRLPGRPRRAHRAERRQRRCRHRRAVLALV